MREKGGKCDCLVLNIHEFSHLEPSFKSTHVFENKIVSEKKIHSFLKSLEVDYDNDMLKFYFYDVDKIRTSYIDPYEIITKRRNILHVFESPYIRKKAGQRSRINIISKREIEELRRLKLSWDILGSISEGLAHLEAERLLSSYKKFDQDTRNVLGLYAALCCLTGGSFGLYNNDLIIDILFCIPKLNICGYFFKTLGDKLNFLSICNLSNLNVFFKILLS